jgi:SP family general alpha glucoside:H+ symporter-like MFS transporter
MLSRTDQWGYRIPFALQWMWPLPLIALIFFSPESPWWLVRAGRTDAAKKSLLRLTGRNSRAGFNPDDTISMMIHTNKMEKEQSEGTSYLDLFRGSNLRRTEIACCTYMIQTLCGSTFMGYSTYFYKEAGMAVENSFNMSLGQYALGAIGTVCSWFLMLKLGRRTLYLGGQVIMCALLLAIGCASFGGRENVAAQWAIGSMLLVYTFVYDSTVGPVCYSLVSELTSTRLRTKSICLARAMYNCTGIITNITTPRMLNPTAWNWGAKSGFFWAGTCLVAAVWTYFRLPEPKGRTFGEIDILFEKGVSARKFKKTVVERLDARTEKTGFGEEKGPATPDSDTSATVTVVEAVDSKA